MTDMMDRYSAEAREVEQISLLVAIIKGLYEKRFDAQIARALAVNITPYLIQGPELRYAIREAVTGHIASPIFGYYNMAVDWYTEHPDLHDRYAVGVLEIAIPD